MVKEHEESLDMTKLYALKEKIQFRSMILQSFYYRT